MELLNAVWEVFAPAWEIALAMVVSNPLAVVLAWSLMLWGPSAAMVVATESAASNPRRLAARVDAARQLAATARSAAAAVGEDGAERAADVLQRLAEG